MLLWMDANRDTDLAFNRDEWGERLGVCSKTIQRDIQLMRAIGIELDYDRRLHGYKLRWGLRTMIRDVARRDG